jgi:hypothetical protein
VTTALVVTRRRVLRHAPPELERIEEVLERLARGVDRGIPVRMRRLDRMIEAGDREIARLRRDLTRERSPVSAQAAMNVRQPDLFAIAEGDRESAPLHRTDSRSPARKRAA